MTDHFINFCKALEALDFKFEAKVTDFPHGRQVLIYDNNGNIACDVICNDMSYGGENGLLEGMSGPYVTDCDEVTGWLTAGKAILLLLDYQDKNPDWLGY